MQQLRRYSVRIAALLLSVGLAVPALAQVGRFDDPDAYRERLEPPPSLPQSFNSIIRPPSGEEIPKQISTLSDIGRAMQACWQPTGVRYSGQEVTIRISFKRNGEVLGKPMITHYRAGEPDAENREAFTQAVRAALVRCSPMPFTDKLGAAVAGRPFTFRFIDAPAPQKQQAL
ncbi:hypothetical protein VB618_03440 [Microvirga sp. CF3062]|uniref:hypothetical protein n=1 Tax=Microvirga sp. CF3062 TaxID=3110182 RepID=UPI002E793103|nr:hypothetical protein [Microvirga sp. CF3062]MEE1655238.1 hypothetical protein [Microvirga sp. CF3062]